MIFHKNFKEFHQIKVISFSLCWQDVLIISAAFDALFSKKALDQRKTFDWSFSQHHVTQLHVSVRRMPPQPDLTDSHQCNKFQSLMARLQLVSRDKLCSARSADRLAHVGFNWAVPLMPVTHLLILHEHTHAHTHTRSCKHTYVRAAAGAPSRFIFVLTSPPLYPSNPMCAASGGEIILREKNGVIRQSSPTLHKENRVHVKQLISSFTKRLQVETCR